MGNIKKTFELWKENVEDKKYKEALENLSQDEVYESFYKNLEFGTAGLRGIMGMGTNRMNIYTVRQATQGFSDYLKNKYKLSPISVAISYDSRNNSYEFAKESARVLAANNIKVYITDELKPTPVLSYAVRNLNCQGGIMITASHNPPEYNGYKCYGEDGAQILDDDAKKIYGSIEKVDIFKDVKLIDFESGLNEKNIEFIDESLYDKYIENVMKQSINKDSCNNSGLRVVYTPLNGAGNKTVRKVISLMGIKNFFVVPEQENPDGNFTTCPYPNPESEKSFSLAKDLARENKADLIVSTDPDCDRIGVCVFDGKDYVFLTGNQIGVLLVSYILKYREFMGTLPKNPVVIKTIVSTSFIDKIAKKYNCEVINVLTGFKYIGREILKLEKIGQSQRYIFGFEESHGYLIGTYARDKDAVVATMMICEMAAFYKKEKLNLIDVLEGIYREFGNFYAKNINLEFSGSNDDMKKIKTVMENLRKNPLKSVGGLEVKNIVDFMQNVNSNFPKSNVIRFELEKDSTIIIRPSGTEPKIKIYVMSGDAEILNNISKDINSIILQKQ